MSKHDSKFTACNNDHASASVVDNVADKHALASSFGRAATSYDEAAELQRIVGFELIRHVQAQCQVLAIDHPDMLDLGCGTGFFGKHLIKRLRPSHCTFADISSDMLSAAKARVCAELPSYKQTSFIELDAENLGLNERSLDLVFSSLALQWVGDLQSTLAGVHRVLKPGGMLAFSTLLDGTLHELKSSWAAVDSEQHVNTFMSLDECKAIAEGSGMRLCEFVEHEVVMPFKGPLEVMRSLKAIGAHNISAHRPKGLTSRARLRRVIGEYEGFRREDGFVPASYKVAYVVLVKDS